MKNNLTDAEKELVQAFVENEAMYNAVKKVVLYTIYGQGTLESAGDSNKNWVFAFTNDNPLVENNSILGERVRAVAEGLGYADAGFEKLKEFKKVEQVEKPVNPAL